MLSFLLVNYEFN